jgi:hypothetical protein
MVRNTQAATTMCAFFLLGAAMLVGWQWANRYEERPILNIQAAYDVPELALPVFAQFVVTEHLLVPDPVMVTRLQVPLYIPAASEMLQIDLRRNGELIDRWRYEPTVFEQVTTADLPLATPRLLDGAIDVVFSGAHIPHAEQAQAPRLFIESELKSYPGMYYQVAANKKDGNVSVTLIGRLQPWVTWQRSWDENPAAHFALVGQWLMVGLMIWALPFLFRPAVVLPENSARYQATPPTNDQDGFEENRQSGGQGHRNREGEDNKPDNQAVVKPAPGLISDTQNERY